MSWRLARGSLKERLLSGWPLRLLVFVALSVVLVPVAQRRLIDGDEGYLLMGARLVSQGQWPYADFFSPQMPVLSYVFGLGFAVAGRSWTWARTLCGLFAAGTGLCLFEYVWRALRSRGWALFATLLYVSQGFVLGWLTITKTYGLTTFFAMAGALVLVLPRRRFYLVLGGLCFALAAATRLYAAVLLPCGLVFVWRHAEGRRQALRSIGVYALGAVVGGLVVVPSLLASPQAFWFGVFEFHGMREAGQNTLVGDFRQKWEMLSTLLPYKGMEGPTNVQFLALLGLALSARLGRAGRGFGLAGGAWLALFVASLLPTPTHAQYFCVLVPLMLADGMTLLEGRRLRDSWAPALVVALLCLGAAQVEVERFTMTGLNVPGVWSRERVDRWSLRTMKQVARAIDAQGLPEGASWWPGYFVGTRTPIVRGLANDFGLRVANRVTPQQKVQYHLVSHEDVAAMIVAHDPPLFVEGNWAATPPANLLPVQGYELAASVANVRVWRVPR